MELLSPEVEDLDVFDPMAESLETQGWFCTDTFFNVEACRAFRHEAEALMAQASFFPAGIVAGAGDGKIHDPTIRRDWIHWLDTAQSPGAMHRYSMAMERLRLALNRRLMLGLWSLEAHFACYPPGAFYGRHLDRIGPNGARILSCTCYLNEDWSPEDGGALRLYPGGEDQDSLDILPLAGRFVCFLSDSVAHEVLVSHRNRWSVTGWFRLRHG